MNNTVVVDVDGVLADFESAFCRKFGNERRELESLESRYPRHTYYINRFVNDLLTYNNLNPISLGAAVVDYLYDNGFTVHIISGRPLDTERLTIRWLKRFSIPYHYFGVHPNKSAYIGQMQPLAAIDDLMSVSKALKRYNVPTLLMQHSWNWYYEDKSRIFSNIQEFITKFTQLIANKEKK